MKREFLATMVLAGIVFGLSGEEAGPTVRPLPDPRAFAVRSIIDTALHKLGRGAIKVANENLTDFIAANKLDVNVADDAGNTPLHEAAKYRKLRVMAALLTAGANINAQASRGQTALHFAAASNFIPGITLLLKRGARSDLVAEGQTPYELASLKRIRWSRVVLTPCIEALVRAGVVPCLLKNEGGAMFLCMYVPVKLAESVLSKHDYGFFLGKFPVVKECFRFVFQGRWETIEGEQLPGKPRYLSGFEDVPCLGF